MRIFKAPSIGDRVLLNETTEPNTVGRITSVVAFAQRTGDDSDWTVLVDHGYPIHVKSQVQSVYGQPDTWRTTDPRRAEMA